MRSSPAERGVALILVLVILPLVAILMTQLSFETAIGDRLAKNGLANQQFKLAILARVRQMRLRLVRDFTEDQANAQQQGGAWDHYADAWGSDAEGGGTAAMVSKGEDEDEITLYTQVIDEQGKFNINLLIHKDPKRAARAFETLVNLLNFFRDARFEDLGENEYDLDDSECRQVADAIKKFVTGDERDERVNKVELPDPAPELRQRIFTVRDLLFSHALFVEKRLLDRFTDVKTGVKVPSLEEFLTVFGDGKINVNTAPIQVLRAMFKEPEGQTNTAANLLHHRGGFLETDEDQEKREEAEEERKEREEQGLEEEETDESAFKSTNDIAKVEGMGDGAFLRRNEIDVGRDFAVRSNFFLVVVTARRDNFLRQQRVVFERHGAGCLTWASEVRSVDLGDIPGAGDEPENPEE